MPLTERELYESARDQIRHEDGLINQRVTWLLLLQGLLFTAFAGGVGLFEKFQQNPRACQFLILGLLVLDPKQA